MHICIVVFTWKVNEFQVYMKINELKHLNIRFVKFVRWGTFLVLLPLTLTAVMFITIVPASTSQIKHGEEEQLLPKNRRAKPLGEPSL